MDVGLSAERPCALEEHHGRWELPGPVSVKPKEQPLQPWPGVEVAQGHCRDVPGHGTRRKPQTSSQGAAGGTPGFLH